ncbi:MAG: sulfatase [Chloroflexota bacterium]
MSTQSQPNVIWIFGDQHRAQALGYMGDPNVNTPNIDRLASEGVTFTNAVAGCPWCTPYRGALMTSRYIHKAVQRTPQKLDPTLPTVADAFNGHGYRTAFFGKWHLGGFNQMTFIPRDERARFDVWIGYENNNAQYDCWVHGHDLDGRDDVEPLAEKLASYETDALTDKLITFVEKHEQQRDSNSQDSSEQPFFAILSVQPPHDPHVAPPDYEERFDPATIKLRPNVPDIPRITERARRDLAGYYAQIENLDWNVGRVMETLRTQGIDDNTHVIFFSDHGDMLGSHGYWRKSSPWEEAVRTPCIVRPAGGLDEQDILRTSDAPMNHVDYAPTSLGLCGFEAKEWMSGTDFSHHVLPSRPVPEHEPQSAYLQQVFRKRFDCLNRVWRGIRTRDGWKYVCLEGQPLFLFNLNEDPYELANLAYLDTFHEKRMALQAELAGWIEQTEDEFELPEE